MSNDLTHQFSFQFGQRVRVIAPHMDAGATGMVMNAFLYPDGTETIFVAVPGGDGIYKVASLESVDVRKEDNYMITGGGSGAQIPSSPSRNRWTGKHFNRLGWGATAFMIGGILMASAARQVAASKLWQTNLVDAKKISREAKRPMLVEVYTDWCRSCNELDTHAMLDDQVKADLKNFVCIKVNADRSPDFAHLNRIDTIPALLKLDSNGNELDRRIGSADAKTISTWLKKSK